MQIGTYLYSDIKIIESKLSLFENMIIDEENQQPQYEMIISLWSKIKNTIL